MMRRACLVFILLSCLISIFTAAVADAPNYTAEEIKTITAEVFLERMLHPLPGYVKFADMNALGQKVKQSSIAERELIMPMVVGTMMNTTLPELQRFQCCYVISVSGDQKAVPNLVDVLTMDKSETMRSVAAEALGDFPKSIGARDALLRASKREKSPKVLEVINKRLAQGEAEYTAEQIKSTTAETFIERLLRPEAGYAKFAAMHGLGQKAKKAGAIERGAIMTLVLKTMTDTKLNETQRFQCCYVISTCGDQQWVPDLIEVLENDKSETMRSVAAEALADFPGCAAAHDALLEAARRDTSPRVREVLIRRLGAEMPAD